MQDEKPEEIQNTFLVQVGVVGGAILLLLIIIVYLHFDARITKFIEDFKKGYKSCTKTTKAKIRHRVVRTQNSAKARVMNKLRMIRGKYDSNLHNYFNIHVCPLFRPSN